MSFNRSLWKATGALIGTEARALMNLGKGGSDFWAPVVNLARDGTVSLLPPSVLNISCSHGAALELTGRWGRNIETPGVRCRLTRSGQIHSMQISY
eukprot:COSAG02_NODE_16254_length_1099_cov_1.086000_3_plen_96_part_00